MGGSVAQRAPSPFILPEEWVLRGRAGRGQHKDPKMYQGEGCRTCCLCLERAGARRAAWCSGLSHLLWLPSHSELLAQSSDPVSDEDRSWQTLHGRDLGFRSLPLPHPSRRWGCCEGKGLRIASPPCWRISGWEMGQRGIGAMGQDGWGRMCPCTGVL